jgi:ATP-binding cassette, subfamily B, bacterial CvaB/MchF/RaxB
VDGRPLDAAGMAAFRAQAGVAMQDDALRAVSIAENIIFFDPRPGLEWMRACAQLAGMDAEVMAMTYGTLVGDLGMALSGGQRQRLARAPYRRPKILLMDNGTSHLDVTKEREVNAALAALDITRIVIAHLPETIAAADRVVVLRAGRRGGVAQAGLRRRAATRPSRPVPRSARVPGSGMTTEVSSSSAMSKPSRVGAVPT